MSEPLCLCWVKVMSSENFRLYCTSYYYSVLLKTFHILSTGPLEICLGDPDKSSCVYVNLPSQAASAQFKEVEGILPNTPSLYALRLFSIFFSEREQALSCYTKAKGRKLLDQDILKGMKGILMWVQKYKTIIQLLLAEQINFKFPASSSVAAEIRWHDIV